MIDNSMEDWRLALSASRVLQLSLELVICAIHPPPGKHDFIWTVYDNENRRMQSSEVGLPTNVYQPVPVSGT